MLITMANSLGRSDYGSNKLWLGFSKRLDGVANDIVNFAAAKDAPGLEGKYPFTQLLHSFEVHYPIRFPRFTTVG